MTRQQTIGWLKGITLVGVYGGLLMPLMFWPVVIFPFVFSKLVFFQVLIGLTFPAYLMLAWMEPAYRPRWHLLYGAIGAYFVALLLSVIFAVDPFRAWWGNQERMNGLFTLLHFFAWLTMTISLIKTWEQWRRLLNFQIVLSVFMALVALMQKIKPDLLLFPAGPRVGGLLDNPIYMASYQIFNLFFLGMLFLRTSSKTTRTWYGIAAVFQAWAFVEAQSRGALLGLAVGIAALAFFVAVFSRSRKWRITVLGLTLALFAAYGTLFAFRNTSVIQNSPFARLTNFSASVGTRFIAWRIAWEGFKERPVYGWGLDSFHLLFNQKYNPYSLRYGLYETWFDRSHNTILDVMSMTGLVGLVTFLGLFVALFYAIWKAFRAGRLDLPFAALLAALPIAYFVQNLFVFDHPAAFSMSYLLFALVIAATRSEFNHASGAAIAVEGQNKRRNFSWPLLLGVQAALLLVVWRVSLLPFQASRYSIMANNAFAAGQMDASLAIARQAAEIWTPYLDEQVFLLSRNIISGLEAGTFQKYPRWKEYYALAKDRSDREFARHPLDTHGLYIYARLVQEMAALVPEDAALAERLFKQALVTSPKRQQLYYGLAKLYMTQGRQADVLETFRQIRDLDPEFGEGYWNLGLSLFYDKNDKSEGSKQMIKSQTVSYPYVFRDARELVGMAEAYVAQNDKDGLRALVKKMPDVPVNNDRIQIFSQLAYFYQRQDMPTERDAILAYGKTLDPLVQAAYQQLVSGVVAPAQTVQSAPVQAPVTANSVSTATQISPGPRR